MNKTEGHHKNYHKPLEVIWFCRKHHKIEHCKKKSYRRKISYWLGKKQPKWFVEKRILPLRGKTKSLAHRKAIHLSLLGRKFSKQTLIKMSLAAKKRWRHH